MHPNIFLQKNVATVIAFQGSDLCGFVYDHDLITSSPNWFYTNLKKKSCDKPLLLQKNGGQPNIFRQ